MNYHKKINDRFSVFLMITVAFIFMWAGFVYGREGEDRTVRVAFPIQAGLTEIDDKGNYSGYTYEYLQEIAQYTGWNYEFVQIPGDLNKSLMTQLDMVKNGEIDLMGGILYSDEMNAIYDYDGHSYGMVKTVLQVPYDDPNDIIIDSQVIQKMRIAVSTETGERIDELNDYCKINLIVPEYVVISGQEEMVQAIHDGKADVMLNTNINYIEGVRTIAEFSPKPFYFITSKGNNTGLIQELNSALSSINRTDPDFAQKLFEKYFYSSNENLTLTNSEQAYIKQRGQVNVGVLTNEPPFQYRDSETEEIKGISIDLLDYISKQTGLMFSFVPADSMEQLWEMAEQGEIDMTAGISRNYMDDKNRKLSLSRPYISAQYILMMSESLDEEDLAGKRVVLPKDSNYRRILKEDVALYESSDDCIRSLLLDEAGYTYVDGYTAQYYVNHPEFRNLRMVPQAHDPREVSFGIVKAGSFELLNILNKAINTIPDDKIQGIIYQNTVYRQDFSLSSLMRANPIESVLSVSAVMLFIILILSYGMVQRYRMSRQISLNLKKHLQIYELVNDIFFEYDYKEKEFTLSKPGTDSNAEVLKFSMQTSLNETEKKDFEEFMGQIKPYEEGIREVKIKCQDGIYRWMRIAVKVVYDREIPAYAVGKITDIDREIKEREQLRKRAERDSLTYVFNAATSRRLIEREMESLAEGKRAALILVDIDNFKLINDTYGHLCGDQILIQVAKALTEGFGKEEIVGRPGGDEFIVYMPDIKNRETLETRCSIICEKISQIQLNDEKTLTASVGATFVFLGKTYDEFFKETDNSLYISKKRGRNQFYISEPAPVE